MSEQDIHAVNDPDTRSTAAEQSENSPDADTAQGADSVEQLRNETASLKEQLLRKAAEFENFKRRTRDEKDELMKYGAESLIRSLLSVLDDFERSLDAGTTHPDFESFYKGIEIIYSKLLRTLEQRGLTPMDAKGKPFDVDFHDALLQVPTSEAEPGIVLDVAEKGYMLHDKVIRHAKVTVSIEPPTSEGTGQA